MQTCSKVTLRYSAALICPHSTPVSNICQQANPCKGILSLRKQTPLIARLMRGKKARDERRLFSQARGFFHCSTCAVSQIARNPHETADIGNMLQIFKNCHPKIYGNFLKDSTRKCEENLYFLISQFYKLYK